MQKRQFHRSTLVAPSTTYYTYNVSCHITDVYYPCVFQLHKSSRHCSSALNNQQCHITTITTYTPWLRRGAKRSPWSPFLIFGTTKESENHVYETHTQGLRQLVLTVSWDLYAYCTIPDDVSGIFYSSSKTC